MNSMEEQLWSYIDGTCNKTEQEAIALLIATNEEYKQQYEELMSLHRQFANIDLDEPHMAFTYHVMEQIRKEEALSPLKSKIDKRYIYAIAGFFMITILALLTFTLVSAKWTGNVQTTGLIVPVKIKLPNTGSIFTGPLFKGFLFFDVVLGLFLIDGYFRKKSPASQSRIN